MQVSFSAKQRQGRSVNEPQPAAPGSSPQPKLPLSSANASQGQSPPLDVGVEAAKPTNDERAEPHAKLPLSAGQISAIYNVMKTFREDDRSRVGLEARFKCARCGCSRLLAGSVLYGEVRLCNGCATDYEILRTAGLEPDLLLRKPEGSG